MMFFTLPALASQEAALYSGTIISRYNIELSLTGVSDDGVVRTVEYYSVYLCYWFRFSFAERIVFIPPR